MPDSIDSRAINAALEGGALPPKQALENAMLCLNAAKAMGCTLAHVAPTDIIAGDVGHPSLHAQLWIIHSVPLTIRHAGSSSFAGWDWHVPVFVPCLPRIDEWQL